MNDLTLALWTAADRATADRDPLPASPVLSRIHRRRTVRYASQGAVGVAAAGAAVVGGVQAVGRAPEPSPAATDLADAMTIRCGASIDEYAQPGGAPDVEVLLYSLDPAAVVPSDADVPLTVDVSAAADAVDQAGTSITYALFQGGRVVGLPVDGWVDDGTDGFVDEGEPARSRPTMFRYSDVQFAACQEDGTVAESPAAGTYGLVAFLVPDDASDWPVPFRSNGVVVHLGEPTGPEGRRPSLDSLVISPDGVGPVRLGQAPPAEGPSAVVEWRDRDCITFDGDGSRLVTGRWAATYSWRTTPDGTVTEPFGVAMEDGRVSRIEVVTDGLATEAGVQVGDSLDDVRAAYPDATLVGHVAGSGRIPGRDVWAVTDGDGVLSFEVTTDEPARPATRVTPGTVAAIVVSLGEPYEEGTVALGLTCG